MPPADTALVDTALVDTALFDFDGTLTWCDTLLPFLRTAVGRGRFWTGMATLSPVLAGMKAGVLANGWTKQVVLSHFLRGWSQARLDEAARRFVDGTLPRLINPAGVRQLRWHRDQGHRVLVISASPEFYLVPWAAGLGVDSVLGTRLDMADGHFTGRLLGANCHGPEKVARLTAHLATVNGSLDGHCLHAYGDSRGDHEMLAIAHHRHYRPFREVPAPPLLFLRAIT